MKKFHTLGAKLSIFIKTFEFNNYYSCFCCISDKIFHNSNFLSADYYFYHSDLVFWMTFVCIVVACMIIWTPMSMYSHIFGCSFLGAYAFFIALNYYLGGNLQYIVINTYRRATVRNFNNAVISPPFQVIGTYFSANVPFYKCAYSLMFLLT